MTQEEYIAILFDDCGYVTSAQRRAWLSKRFGRAYADELTTQERSRAIDLLKEEKLPEVGEYEKELDRRTASDPTARFKAR